MLSPFFSPWGVSRDSSTREELGGMPYESTSMMSPWQGGMGQHLMPFQRSMLSQDMQKFSPILSMDFIETENEFHVQADLPGIDPESLQLSIDNDCLTVSAERKKVFESSQTTDHRTERTYGKVQRTIRLPTNANQNQPSATFEHGVLTISFPKMESAQAPKKIMLKKMKK